MRCYNSGMSRFLFTKANGLRSLFLSAYVLSTAACAQATPTPLPVLPTIRPAIPAAAPNTDVTDTPTVEPTIAPTSTPIPTAKIETSSTVTPTRAATVIPPPTNAPTETHIPPTHASTQVPTVAPPVQPSPSPTTQAAIDPPPQSFQPTELVYSPDGLLKMGSNVKSDDDDEKPQRDIQMGAFNIEKYEVTNAQYQACVAAKACNPPTSNALSTNGSYFGNPAFYDFPVVNVTWFDAAAYCKWIQRRLPNEGEWERAARGVDNWRFSWSNSIGMHFEWNAIFHGSPLSFCEASCPQPNYWQDVNDGYPFAAPVGRFGQYDISKGIGAVDMDGNVSEWTNNWYVNDAYQKGIGVNGPGDPTGLRTVRGGSWADAPTRLSDRNPMPPDSSSDRIGFRCAQ
jgi:formylglycine-generating enzyme required for sulfatase activity